MESDSRGSGLSNNRTNFTHQLHLRRCIVHLYVGHCFLRPEEWKVSAYQKKKEGVAKSTQAEDTFQQEFSQMSGEGVIVNDEELTCQTPG
jgi:hypothetical protein